MIHISGQNRENISKFDKTMNKKKETSMTKARTALLTKPAKDPSWTKNLSLENIEEKYIKN